MPDSHLTPSSGAGFEEVLAELLLREEAGESADLEQYALRFPDLAERLRTFFRNRKRFDLAVGDVLTPEGRANRDTVHGGAAATLVASPTPFASGTPFGPYELLQELGRGGMGVVYRARHRELSHEVALKVIRTDRLAGMPAEERRRWLERFRREAQL